MQYGMLWYDADPKTSLTAKIERAVAYYKKKYGQEPNLCLVNPGAIVGKEKPDEITVRPWQYILPGHLWIGTEGANA